MTACGTAIGGNVPVGGCPKGDVGDNAYLDYFTADDAALSPGAIGVQRNNHPLVNFPDDSDQLVYFSGLVGLSWGGDTLALELYWVAESAELGDVEWFMALERDNPGHNITADSFGVEKSMVSLAPGTTGDIRKVSFMFTAAEADGLTPGDPYRIRLRRDGGEGNDDMPGAAQFFRLGITGFP